MNTRRLHYIVTALVVTLALSGTASAQDNDNDHCSNATLRGDYAFRVYGPIQAPGFAEIPTRDGVAMTHFDGAGKLTQVDFIMQYPDKGLGSSPVPGEPDSVTQFNTAEQGSYTVYPDCTGEMEIDFPPVKQGGAVIKARFVLADGARTLFTIVYFAQPPNAPGPVPALIHSEGHKLGAVGPIFGSVR